MSKTITLLYMALFGLLASCSSSSLIQVKSDPEGADVYVRSMSSTNREKLGQTPLMIKGDELEKKKLKEGPLFVIVEKEGFEKEKVLLSETQAVDLEVSMKLAPTDNTRNAKKIDTLSVELFEVQRFIRNKDYQSALEITKKLKDRHPEISVANELEGSIFYLQQDYKKSFEAFSLAYAKNTENMFALKMKKILKQKLGTKGN